MSREDILRWLHETDEQRLEQLWALADAVRRRQVGDAVHLRGLIEFSNHCARQCAYCGLRASRRSIRRYRMTEREIMAAAHQAAQQGCGTVVLQSGEDRGFDTAWLAGMVRQIKQQTNLAVTLSVGERTQEELATWRAAGADRYLLRFETSDRALYERIHPPSGDRASDRVAIIRLLRQLGYEIGSGIMVGIPGQSYESLASDIALFAELDLDMIGLGPYIAHPGTPLGCASSPLAADEQVRNTDVMACNVIALARLVCPRANIPSTTALATTNRAQGYELGLMRGANVVMPNVTPPQYRVLYEIYPAKAGSTAADGETPDQLLHRIRAIDRTLGTGRGDSPNYVRRFTCGGSERTVPRCAHCQPRC